MEPEKWLRYVIEHIRDWPANRVRDLLPWKVDLELSVNINTVLTSRLRITGKQAENNVIAED